MPGASPISHCSYAVDEAIYSEATDYGLYIVQCVSDPLAELGDTCTRHNTKNPAGGCLAGRLPAAAAKKMTSRCQAPISQDSCASPARGACVYELPTTYVTGRGCCHNGCGRHTSHTLVSPWGGFILYYGACPIARLSALCPPLILQPPVTEGFCLSLGPANDTEPPEDGRYPDGCSVSREPKAHV